MHLCLEGRKMQEGSGQHGNQYQIFEADIGNISKFNIPSCPKTLLPVCSVFLKGTTTPTPYHTDWMVQGYDNKTYEFLNLLVTQSQRWVTGLMRRKDGAWFRWSLGEGETRAAAAGSHFSCDHNQRMLKPCLGLPCPDGYLMRTEEKSIRRFTVIPSTEADHYAADWTGWGVEGERKKKIKTDKAVV